MYVYPNQNQYTGAAPYPQYIPQQAQMGYPIKDDRVWVQGEVGAKAYMVVPGYTVPLWDTESKRIFLKSVNIAGVPAMQEIEYKFVGEQQAAMMDMESRFENIEKRLAALEPKEAAENV